MKLIKLYLLVLIFQLFSCEESYYIKIGDKEFPFTLKDTAVANELKAKFPFEVEMTNLNGNEIYYKFDNGFTTNTKSVGTINTGDIYLYQSDYLVLFYKTFTTSYQYSEIGSLSNADGLADVIGSNSKVKVEWCVKNTQNNNTASDNTKTDSITNDTTKPETNSTHTDEATDDNDFPRVYRTSNKSFFWKLNIIAYISLILITIL